MKAIYDDIGQGYSAKRGTDPNIAQQLYKELVGAKRILNIGAGTGSYEPSGHDLIAVEPSVAMIKQRDALAYPVKQASADALPFENKYFSHTMTILSMHHWHNRAKAFEEINRVTTDKFVAITWFPNLADFWLTKDYFPEILKIDSAIFPSLNEIELAFGTIETKPLLIPKDCIDGFLAAYWARPEAYLDATVRASISTFSKISNLDSGLSQLAQDLKSGQWLAKYGRLLSQDWLDVGYRIVTVDFSKKT